MADKKISALTGATTPLAGTEVLPIVQSGATVKVAVSDLTAGRAVSATQLTSTIAIGTAPLVVTSTTNVANLNASSLNGATFAAPGAIGGGTASAITATTVNKVTITAPATASTLTIADGKTLTASNTLTLAGTDATTQTFPTTSATIARTDAAQTFTGLQTYSTAAGESNGFQIKASGWNQVVRVGINGTSGDVFYTSFNYSYKNATIDDSTQGTSSIYLTGNNLVISTGAVNTAPSFRFQIYGALGDVYAITGNFIADAAGKGITLKSPDGLTVKTLTISNLGVLTLI